MLYADTVCEIHDAARDCGIPRRQFIINWFFSMDGRKINDVTSELYGAAFCGAALCEAGVNDVLLSVDAFHQEYIPLELVELFAESLLRHSVPS